MAGVSESGRGLSHTVSMLLIVILGLVIVLLVVGMLTGFAGLLQKSHLIAIRGSFYTTHEGTGVLVLTHIGGDVVTLNPAFRGDEPVPVKFSIVSPANATFTAGVPSAIVNDTWRPGEFVVIYRDNSGYWVTNNITARLALVGTSGQLLNIDRGTWTISVIDAKTNALFTKVSIVADTL